MNVRALLFPRPPFRLPRRTVRLRLTAVYAGLFLLSGAGLLAITYVLVRHSTGDVLIAKKADGTTLAIAAVGPKVTQPARAGKRVNVQFTRQVGEETPTAPRPTRAQLEAQIERDMALAKRQRSLELRQLVEQSGIALAIMAALSIVLGWLAAGRVLRPLRTLNEHAREISASSLHKRLALSGPDDELKQLGDTFDDLLVRLQDSFEAQRQFVANASHELRSPLARARTLSEVALADPEASVESLRASHRRVLAAGEQQERLIEALLTLARSERGLDRQEPFDLSIVARNVLATRRPEAERRQIHVRAMLQPAETSGDPRLAERLVANLVDNALRHNLPAGGRIDVTTSRNGRATLSVANSGEPVPPGEVERLLQPFQRLGAERTDHTDGVGLGLSIVQAIAAAHGATLAARPRASGGLDVEVGFVPAGAPAA